MNPAEQPLIILDAQGRNRGAKPPAPPTDLDSLRRLLMPIALLCALALLYFARDVFAPVAIAALIAQGLAPACGWMERKLPSFAAAGIAVISFVAVVAVLVVAVSRQLYDIQTSLPALAQEFGRLELQARALLREYFGASRAPAFKLADLVQNFGAFALTALGSTMLSLATAFLIVVLTFLLLAYRMAIYRHLQQLAVVNGWPGFAAMADRVTVIGQHYLFGLGCVVLIATALDIAVQALVGAPYPLFFGILGGLSVLVPYIGIAVVAPSCAVITLLSTGDPLTATLVLAAFVLVHVIEGNLISPWFVGTQVDLNPLATLLAVVVGGELWGTTGMFLAVPAVGIAKIVLETFPSSSPAARLLGRFRHLR